MSIVPTKPKVSNYCLRAVMLIYWSSAIITRRSMSLKSKFGTNFE